MSQKYASAYICRVISSFIASSTAAAVAGTAAVAAGRTRIEWNGSKEEERMRVSKNMQETVTWDNTIYRIEAADLAEWFILCRAQSSAEAN